MALISCRECGQQISDMASACPHCGCPVIVNTNKKSNGLLSVIAGVLTLVVIFAPIGIVMALIDLIAYGKDGKSHKWSLFALVWIPFLVLFIYVMHTLGVPPF